MAYSTVAVTLPGAQSHYPYCADKESEAQRQMFQVQQPVSGRVGGDLFPAHKRWCQGVGKSAGPQRTRLYLLGIGGPGAPGILWTERCSRRMRSCRTGAVARSVAGSGRLKAVHREPRVSWKPGLSCAGDPGEEFDLPLQSRASRQPSSVLQESQQLPKNLLVPQLSSALVGFNCHAQGVARFPLGSAAGGTDTRQVGDLETRRGQAAGAQSLGWILSSAIAGS